MEDKVSWSAELKPLFYSGQDYERILFCLSPFIWEESVAFPHLFLDRPRNLVPLVFEVCMVDVNALLEHAAFLFSLFPGVPLSVLPTFCGLPLEGILRMLFRTCTNQDTDLCAGIDLVFV